MLILFVIVVATAALMGGYGIPEFADPRSNTFGAGLSGIVARDVVEHHTAARRAYGALLEGNDIPDTPPRVDGSVSYLDNKNDSPTRPNQLREWSPEDLDAPDADAAARGALYRTTSPALGTARAGDAPAVRVTSFVAPYRGSNGNLHEWSCGAWVATVIDPSDLPPGATAAGVVRGILDRTNVPGSVGHLTRTGVPGETNLDPIAVSGARERTLPFPVPAADADPDTPDPIAIVSHTSEITAAPGASEARTAAGHACSHRAHGEVDQT